MRSPATTVPFRPLAAAGITTLLMLAGCSTGGSSDGPAPLTTTTTTASATTIATTTAPSSTTTTAPVPEPTTTTTTGATAETTTPSGPGTTAASPSGGPALDAAAAEAKIRGVGDWDPEMDTYSPTATLSAVEARVTGAGSAASPEQVFFFNEGRYLGTGTSEPRIALSITAFNDTSATVQYGHYDPEDSFCCPSLPAYVVTFRWDGSRVVPDGELPPEGQGL